MSRVTLNILIVVTLFGVLSCKSIISEDNMVEESVRNAEVIENNYLDMEEEIIGSDIKMSPNQNPWAGRK